MKEGFRFPSFVKRFGRRASFWTPLRGASNRCGGMVVGCDNTGISSKKFGCQTLDAQHENESLVHEGGAAVHESAWAAHCVEAVVRDDGTVVRKVRSVVHEGKPVVHQVKPAVHERESVIHRGESAVHEGEAVVLPDPAVTTEGESWVRDHEIVLTGRSPRVMTE